MIVRAQRVGPPLDRYIDCLWYMEGYVVSHVRERALPTGTVELVVVLKQQRTRVFVDDDDLRGLDFALWLAKEVGVATVPGTSFYSDPRLGENVTRFAFCKKPETLERAAERLAGMTAKV